MIKHYTYEVLKKGTGYPQRTGSLPLLTKRENEIQGGGLKLGKIHIFDLPTHTPFSWEFMNKKYSCIIITPHPFFLYLDTLPPNQLYAFLNWFNPFLIFVPPFLSLITTRDFSIAAINNRFVSPFFSNWMFYQYRI